MPHKLFSKSSFAQISYASRYFDILLKRFSERCFRNCW